MTFNVSDPAPADKIRNWPSSVTTNEWPRLKAIIEADHTFNNAAGGAPDTSGWHKVVRWVNQAGAYGDNTPAPITTAPGFGQLYTKTFNGTQHLFYHQGTNGVAANEAPLSLWPVRAFALFDSTGAFIVGSTSFNCGAAITKPGGTGVYRMTFDTAMPSAHYMPVITVQPTNSVATKLAGSVVNSSNLTTMVDFQIWSPASNGTASEAFDTCMVMVFGG